MTFVFFVIVEAIIDDRYNSPLRRFWGTFGVPYCVPHPSLIAKISQKRMKYVAIPLGGI